MHNSTPFQSDLSSLHIQRQQTQERIAVSNVADVQRKVQAEKRSTEKEMSLSQECDLKLVDGATNRRRPPSDPSVEIEGAAWGSNKAVEAALALAQQRGDEQLVEPDVAKETDPIQQPLDDAEALATALKQERLRARWTVQQKAIQLLEEQTRAESEAESLQLIPFTPARLLELPVSLRESLILLLSHTVILHVCRLRSATMTSEYQQGISNWSIEFLTHLLTLLDLEASPAVSVMIDALRHFGGEQFQSQPKTSRKAPSESSSSSERYWWSSKKCDPTSPSSPPPPPIEDLMNAQPAKLHLLTQCKIFLEDNISTNCEEIAKADSLSKFTDSNCEHSKWKGSGDDMAEDFIPSIEINPKSPHEKACLSSPPLSDQISSPCSSLPSPRPSSSYMTTNDNKFVEPRNVSAPPSHAVLLRDLLLMCVLSGKFDARVHEVMKGLAESLDVLPNALIIAAQDYIANDVVGSMEKDTKETQRTKTIRRLKVAGVALGIGALTAVTAGLAAPAIAAGFGALGIAGTSGAVTFLGTIGGSAAIGSVFGAGTAGLSGWKYSKRIGKLKVFGFDRIERISSEDGNLALPHSVDRRLSVSSDLQSDLSYSESDLRNSEQGPGNDLEDEENSSLETQGCEGCNVQVSDEGLESIAESPNSSDSQIRGPEDSREGGLGGRLHPPSRGISAFMKSRTEGKSVVTAPSLTVTICVSGWLRSVTDISGPWRELSSSQTVDVYALRWDPDILLELGVFLLTLLSQKFAMSAAQLWLQYTAAGALSAALMWPVALIQYAATLDNTWIACRERALQSGRLLAEALCDRQSIGTRPVTLVGYSMGARVIHSCLLELHRRKAFHLVSDVVLLGAPTSCDKSRWQKAREVVSGRLINVYSRADWVLGFLFRYMEWGVTVAGLSPVKVDGVENVDATGLVRSHAQYADRIQDVMAFIGMHAVPKQRLPCVHFGRKGKRVRSNDRETVA